MKQLRKPTQAIGGLPAYVAALEQKLQQFGADPQATTAFIICLGEEYAAIRLGDLRSPWRFLKQVAGEPPVVFNASGFRADLAENANDNVARHYTAFLFVGYWLPVGLAVPLLWAWEVLGFLRYRLHWSQQDMRSGRLGIQHGRAVRKTGASILPGLIIRDLKE